MLRPQIVRPETETPAICPRCGADNCIHEGDPYAETRDDEWRCSNCGLTSWNLVVHGAAVLRNPPTWGKRGKMGDAINE